MEVQNDNIDPTKSKMLKYTIISLILSVFSFLLVRIGDNLLYTALLRMNGIFHDYKLFEVIYMNGRGSAWTEGMVVFIHTMPAIVYAVIAAMLPHYILARMNWFFRLTVTWISFHLLLMVMSSLVSGLFEFYGLGVALKWLFVNNAVRITGVILILFTLLFASRRFAWYFLRSAPAHNLIMDEERMRVFIRRFVLLPFLFSFAFILPLASETTILDFGVALPLGLVTILILFGILNKVWIPEYEV